MRISDWSSDVCSSDLVGHRRPRRRRYPQILCPDRRVHLRSRLYLDRELRIAADLYRRRRRRAAPPRLCDRRPRRTFELHGSLPSAAQRRIAERRRTGDVRNHDRSEEHTSELQSLMRISYAVFCLKNKNKTNKETECIVT